jgi:predicted SnoaL-like aldol condensation-catalyzing enzyme
MALLTRRCNDMGLQVLRRTDGQERPWTVTAANNAQLVRQVIEEIWNGGDLDLADQVFAPDYVNHGGLIPDLVRGPEAIKVSVALYRLAFPEFRVAVVDLLAQGQTVALRWTARRSPGHDGGSDAPNRDPDTLLGMTFARMIAGQIQESWTCYETAGAERLDQSRVSWLHRVQPTAATA